MKKSSRDIKVTLTSDRSLLKKLELIITDNFDFSSYSSLEDMFFHLDEEEWEKPNLKKFSGLFFEVSKIILLEFRKVDILPSPNLVLELLFQLVQKASIKPTQVIDDLIDAMHLLGLTNAAIIIYPVTSFGIADIGLFGLYSKNPIYFRMKNIVVMPQHNNINRAKQSLEFVKEFFKLKRLKIDEDLLDHYLRSRSLKWFHKNPLLFTKVSFSSHGYYENEYYLIRYLEKNVSIMFLVYTLITALQLPSKSSSFSSRLFNNFETTDIYHYLVFSENNRKLKPSCIPIHRKLSKILEISDLNMDMPISLDENLHRKTLKLLSFVNLIYKESLGSPKSKKKYEWDFFDRVRRSLAFYVRSYQAKYIEDSILFLSIAFEMIYGDRVKDKITKTLATNLAMLFPKKSQTVFTEISNLYAARSSVAHEGKFQSFDLQLSRELYVESLFHIQKLISTDKLNLKDKTPFINYTNQVISKNLGFSPNIV